MSFTSVVILPLICYKMLNTVFFPDFLVTVLWFCPFQWVCLKMLEHVLWFSPTTQKARSCFYWLLSYGPTRREQDLLESFCSQKKIMRISVVCRLALPVHSILIAINWADYLTFINIQHPSEVPQIFCWVASHFQFSSLFFLLNTSLTKLHKAPCTPIIPRNFACCPQDTFWLGLQWIQRNNPDSYQQIDE